MLKRILNVKKGTCNDLIYYELKRPPITTRIRDRQFRFYQKLQEFTPEDAIIVRFLQLCNNCRFLNYYKNLSGVECDTFMNDLERKIRDDKRSMVTYYRLLIKAEKSNIYSAFLNDHFRKIITRWRL